MASHSKAMKYLKIYTDFVTDMEALTDAEKGRLFVMMLEYADGKTPQPQGNERFLWGTARKLIDAQQGNYETMCERNKRNATRNESHPLATTGNESQRVAPTTSQLREEQEQEQEQYKEKTPKGVKEKRFTPPTLAEVKEYLSEINSNIDAERFVDYYQQQGWKLSNGVPMKDWRATIRNWQRRDSKPKSKSRVVAGYEQRPLGDISSMIVDL